MIPAVLACVVVQSVSIPPVQATIHPEPTPAASVAEAWRVFALLNPPGKDRPSAWETWPSAADTFRRDGADPGPWQPVSHPDTGRFELITPADFPNLRRIVHGRMVPVTDPLAVAKRLIEVRLNSVSYDFIRSRELYTVDGQRRAVAQGKVEFPSGSIQLKAGWRPIAEAERPHYHTMTLRLADGSIRLYGLVALNIAIKTLSGWLWASFEHTGVVPLGQPGADPVNTGPVGTVWQHYRLRGTQIAYVDAADQPVLLGNAELEAGLGNSASCMTCHARATLSIHGEPSRLPVFAPAPPGVRRGYVGTPNPGWFGHADAQGRWQTTYASLDFVWSLSQAAEHGPALSSHAVSTEH